MSIYWKLLIHSIFLYVKTQRIVSQCSYKKSDKIQELIIPEYYVIKISQEPFKLRGVFGYSGVSIILYTKLSKNTQIHINLIQ